MGRLTPAPEIVVGRAEGGWGCPLFPRAPEPEPPPFPLNVIHGTFDCAIQLHPLAVVTVMEALPPVLPLNGVLGPLTAQLPAFEFAIEGIKGSLPSLVRLPTAPAVTGKLLDPARPTT